MNNGYNGIELWVDLSTGEITEKPIDLKIVEKFIGMRGYGVKLLYDNVPAGTDPLSEDNLLIYATGPLTGTQVSTGGRFCVVTKSPLTGTIADSHSGGSFGAYMKFAGVDFIVIKGRAATPKYLYVNEGKAELRDASEIWGMETHEATDWIVDKTDKKARVSIIGPAGEKLSKISGIINDKHRAAGRNGVGAVMGSKRLKAIAVNGSKRPELADPEKFKEASDDIRKKLKEHPLTGDALKKFGTSVLVNIINES